MNNEIAQTLGYYIKSKGEQDSNLAMLLNEHEIIRTL